MNRLSARGRERKEGKKEGRKMMIMNNNGAPYVQSVTLTAMANSFGVSPEFIDEELSKFISAGRIHCKIDKVRFQYIFFLI